MARKNTELVQIDKDETYNYLAGNVAGWKTKLRNLEKRLNTCFEAELHPLDCIRYAYFAVFEVLGDDLVIEKTVAKTRYSVYSVTITYAGIDNIELFIGFDFA